MNTILDPGALVAGEWTRVRIGVDWNIGTYGGIFLDFERGITTGYVENDFSSAASFPAQNVATFGAIRARSFNGHDNPTNFLQDGSKIRLNRVGKYRAGTMYTDAGTTKALDGQNIYQIRNDGSQGGNIVQSAAVARPTLEI